MLVFQINFVRIMIKQKKKTTTEIICQNLGLPNQTIFQDYKCILKINFPFFGRLYIGEEHLMFVSNMFGIVKKAAIIIDTITKVTELSNDSFSILGQQFRNQKREQQEFFFSGFKSNNAYKIIYALWKKQKLESDVLTSEKEEDLDAAEKVNQSKQLDQGSIQVNIFNPEIVDAQKQKIVEFMLPCSIDQFYNFFISEDAIYSRKKHLETKKATNVICTPWKRNQEMNAEMRQITAMLKVKGVPFRSEAALVQIWLLTKRTSQEINVKAITQMTDLPYSSHFTCEQHMTVEKATETKCKFSCSAAIIFNKATVMKNTILTRAFADYKEDYMMWYENVKELLEKMKKGQEESEKKKSKSNLNVQFEEYKIYSPTKQSKSLKGIRGQSEDSTILDKKMDSLNRKVNILLVAMFFLVLLTLTNLVYSRNTNPPLSVEQSILHNSTDQL